MDVINNEKPVRIIPKTQMRKNIGHEIDDVLHTREFSSAYLEKIMATGSRSSPSLFDEDTSR